MTLSLITINRNNAKGLRKTMESVFAQTCQDFEYVVVDGASTDGSVDVIQSYESEVAQPSSAQSLATMVCVSEPDAGIYNAMNKGIRMAHGDYIQILNSGDCFASSDVISTLSTFLNQQTAKPRILYGNMVRVDENGNETGRSGEVDFSLRQYFVSTMNHDCCWIERSLFDEFGYYDENLKIVADWKWFLQVIAFGGVKPVYINKDVTFFDCTGISESNLNKRNAERRQVLEEVLPPAVLSDYDRYCFVMEQTDRLRKHHLYGLFYFMERVFFKLEKWHLLR